jgi:DNA-binding XRE family transcriptional regulator
MPVGCRSLTSQMAIYRRFKAPSEPLNEHSWPAFRLAPTNRPELRSYLVWFGRSSTTNVKPQRLENYLRSYRKKSGLTQREVAFLLGWDDGAQISRYEKRERRPPIETALAFKVPQKRKCWQSEAYRTGIVDAVALGVSRFAGLSV